MSKVVSKKDETLKVKVTRLHYACAHVAHDIRVLAQTEMTGDNKFVMLCGPCYRKWDDGEHEIEFVDDPKIAIY